MTTKGKICSKCGRFKAYKYYYRSSHSKDGYRSDCKDCASKQQSDIRKRMKQNNDYITVDKKICCECGRELPIQEFETDYTKKDMHKSYCKDCMKEQRKHRKRIKVVKTSTGRL